MIGESGGLTLHLEKALRPPPDESYGLGFAVMGDPAGAPERGRFGHGGANEGFRCAVEALRHSERGVAIMTNSDRGDALIEPLMTAAYELLHWPR